MPKSKARRDSVEAFADLMERELRANDHKGGWRGFPVAGLRRRIVQELDELRRAIVRGAPPEEVESEAADVANFAMMIAENYRRERDGK